jgi:curved DNA-binding protein CbpA
MNKEKAHRILGINNNVTVEQATKAYKKAIFKHHPDHGGTCESFIELQKAYELVMSSLTYTGKQYNKQKSELEDIQKNYTQELINKMMSIIEALSYSDDVSLNLCGNWIWLTGNTKPIKEKLKSLKFKFSKNKSAWYWYEGKYRRYGGKEVYTLNDIAYRYGKIEVAKTKKTKLQTLQPVMA